jgi:hypothetical protein
MESDAAVKYPKYFLSEMRLLKKEIERNSCIIKQANSILKDSESIEEGHLACSSRYRDRVFKSATDWKDAACLILI